MAVWYCWAIRPRIRMTASFTVKGAVGYILVGMALAMRKVIDS